MTAADEKKKVRLFVAFEVPESHREAVASALAGSREGLGGRWTTTEQQHVTLKFIGWMDPDRLAQVHRICARVAGSIRGSDVSLGELGAFPTLRRARVLWVRVDDPAAISARLATGLDEGLAPLGVEPEERAYTPHLTLARFKPPRDVRDVREAPMPVLDPFPLAAITLFRSHLARGGPRYEVVERFALR